MESLDFEKGGNRENQKVNAGTDRLNSRVSGRVTIVGVIHVRLRLAFSRLFRSVVVW